MTVPPGHEPPYPGACDRVTRLEERFIALADRHGVDLTAVWRALDKLEQTLTERIDQITEAREAIQRQLDGAATHAQVELVEKAVRDALASANTLTEERARRNRADIEKLQAAEVARTAADRERDRIARGTRWLLMLIAGLIPVGYAIVIGLLETTH